ncbi:hypothetical protein LCGC14_0971570 [marine sediment metagenome]|uniref:Uncharacterized protein n=1 Tax=marine sediment metagenome TaxID=412755 RepID=A0A0F9NFZ7_9ZZZZ
MISWSDFQSDMQDITGDATSATLTKFKRWGNLGYHVVLSELGRTHTEKTQTASTVASQQFYTLPSEALYVKSVKVTSSSIEYPIEPIIDQDTWDVLNADVTGTTDIPTFYFVRPGFGVGGTEVGIFPKPASSGNTITLVYEAGDRDLNIDDFTTGTVTVTNGDATVTHSATGFTAAMVGRYFQTDDDRTWYRVASFTSTSVVELENVFEGTTASGASYILAEAFNIPEEMQILPGYYALGHFYDMRHDDTKSLKYRALFDKELRDGKRRWRHKTRGSVINTRRKFHLRNPNFPPGTIT